MIVLNNYDNQNLLLIMYFGILIKSCIGDGASTILGGLIPGSYVDSCQLFMIDKSLPAPPYLDVIYNYPSDVTFSPNLQWEGQLLFQFNYFAEPTYVAIRLTKFQTINNLTNYIYKIRFVIGLYSGAHYSLTTQDFVYTENSTSVIPQNITILGQTLEMLVSVWVLMGYQDMIDQNFLPSYNVPNVTIPISKDIIYIQNKNGTCGYMVKKILFRLIKINHIVMYDLGSFYVINIEDFVCEISNCPFVLQNLQNLYPKNVFYGIFGIEHIKSIGQNSSFFVSTILRSSSNVGAFAYFVTRYYSICPSTQKYWGHFYGQCFSQCPNRTYLYPHDPTQQYNYYKYYCYSCASYCFRCNLIQTNCTECFDQFRYVLVNITLNTHTCICPQGQYGPASSCANCNDTMPFCISCNSSTVCIQCDGGLIFNTVSKACQCPPSRIPTLNNFTYINQFHINITVSKLRCISKRVVENCTNSVVTSTPSILINLFPYGQICSCMTGGPFIENKCV